MGCVASKGGNGGSNNNPPNKPTKKVVVPKVQTGFIKKEGQKYKSWKNRYFVLDSGVISYYTDDIKNSSAQQKGEPMNIRGYKLVENKENAKLLSLEHRTDKEARVLNLSFASVAEKEQWITAFKQHIEYKDALYTEQIEAQQKALEKPKCINSMTIWMKNNAPHIITSKAQIYATTFYNNNCFSIEDVASKIAEKKTFALELGVERDDNDDIINGLLKPQEKNAQALLVGPNMLGKYTLTNPKTSSSITKAAVVEQPPTYTANK